MAQAIYDLFKVDNAFEEYNSPTYYGPDLYALALWRSLAPSPLLRRLGAEMESLLWLDLSRYYHPGLRNMCGPYDRSYGMDMTRYAAVLGQWIWLVSGQAQAPFPALDLPFAHTPDWFYAPQIAFLGAVVPEEARARLLTLDGPRKVEQVITRAPRRVATAYLEENFMWGAEHTSLSKIGSAQFHPATLHWRAAPGQIGWMRLVHRDPVDATVQGRILSIRGSGPLTFQICCARPGRNCPAGQRLEPARAGGAGGGRALFLLASSASRNGWRCATIPAGMRPSRCAWRYRLYKNRSTGAQKARRSSINKKSRPRSRGPRKTILMCFFVFATQKQKNTSKSYKRKSNEQ